MIDGLSRRSSRRVSFDTATSRSSPTREGTLTPSFSAAPFKMSSGIGASLTRASSSALALSAARFEAHRFLIVGLSSASLSNAAFSPTISLGTAQRRAREFMAARLRIALGPSFFLATVRSNKPLERTGNHRGPRLAAARSSWPAVQRNR
jgi:hypothetical protein